ncbi:hypothetical protein L210DRAFT_3506941 [Boletus edulis BED1]|uniref:Uncharacterized protein n=1 Tax=Boletus edulis BED1 TaxID=1328754 RepID=A0AAD4BLR8_BOLED|nr:hypothetical protein L210DRAFT_3506941 [Boletus edulis BED1]
MAAHPQFQPKVTLQISFARNIVIDLLDDQSSTVIMWHLEKKTYLRLECIVIDLLDDPESHPLEWATLGGQGDHLDGDARGSELDSTYDCVSRQAPDYAALATNPESNIYQTRPSHRSIILSGLSDSAQPPSMLWSLGPCHKVHVARLDRLQSRVAMGQVHGIPRMRD